MPSSETVDRSGQATDSEPPEQMYGIIAAVSAVATFVAFTVVGLTALNSVVFGAVAGVMTGGGSYLFLPWFLRVSARSEDGAETLSTAELIEQVPGNPQRSVLGLGFDVGGLVMLAAGFALGKPDLVTGVGAGVAVALAIYFVGSIVLDRMTAPSR